MKNVTATVNDETAATRFERLCRLQDATLAEIRASGSEFRAADNLPREALYERDALR